MDLYKTYISPIVIRTFLFLCKLYGATHSILIETYKNNTTIKSLVNNIIINLFQRTEPTSIPWTCCCYINTENKYEETYNYFFANIIETDLIDNDSDKSYANTYFSKLTETFTNTEILFPLVILKTEAQPNDTAYIVRIGGKKYDNILLEKSTAKFLSIIYSHPIMQHNIELFLEPEWFYSGNELFTPSFVLRALEYQPSRFIFDENYSIKIMDSELNIFNINQYSHILLTADNYKIKYDNVIEINNENESDTSINTNSD